MNPIEASKEAIVRPLGFAATKVKSIGVAALELIDNERLVRRLQGEWRDGEIHQAYMGLEAAHDTGNPELIRAEACHVVRVVMRGVVSAIEREELALETHLDFIRTLLRTELDGIDGEEMGFTDDERILIMRLKEVTS